MTFDEQLNGNKGYIIQNMFLRTADDNYIVARWCHENDLITDFFWNAAHALEKYMKAVLLYNGESTRNLGHDLGKIYCEVCRLAEDLLPTMLTKPPNLEIHNWVNLKPSEFLDVLECFGSPDNRYAETGFVQPPRYLQMLDQMVWSLRRIALRLDKAVPDWDNRSEPPTLKEDLKGSPRKCYDRDLPLDNLLNTTEQQKRDALLNLNYWFAPQNYQHRNGSSGNSAQNSPIWLTILEPLNSGLPQKVNLANSTADWLLENVKLGKELKKKIISARPCPH
jgi:hypothetical protein